MTFRKINNLAGWIVCAIASLVYLLTAEMRGSFWDCGEFVSACYKVQLPHPPGAPLFVLLGKFFIILFGDNPMTAAKAVNSMNAIASGLTILFLFWTITHFARKLIVGTTEEPSFAQSWTIIGAGIVGGLAYTFSDSFWYSAVEGEVYALSSLFTALAFWIILKWERADDAAGADRQRRNEADRWIVFLFFTLGLSIGIHLLGLLVIPAAVMVYYFKRYAYTRKGAIWAFLIGCVITGVVQVVVIKWSVALAGRFDIFFVNGFGLPFFSGFAFFFILLGVLVWLGLRWAAKNNWSFLRLGLWCFAFMMFGYSMYLSTMIRSNANPALDMNNVDNPMSLVYYLGRDQYGSQPILTGPHYAAPIKADNNGNGQLEFSKGKMRYGKGANSYVEIGRESEPEYYGRDMMLFPRVWDSQNEQQHVDFYRDWLGLEEYQAPELVQVAQVDDDNNALFVVNKDGKQQTIELPSNFRRHVRVGEQVGPGQPLAFEVPSYPTNIQWFMSYQMGFMYWRYFMWNFAGKQNDIQGSGNPRDGNWITGISAIDNVRLGDQSVMPDSLKNNKEHNKLFLLPFVLGLIGCIYQFVHNRKDWIISFLLFFFTGAAIVVYLNQAGNQPRERDYAFAGSFYAYAIWIGLAVVALVKMAMNADRKTLYRYSAISGGVGFVILLLSDIPLKGSNAVIGSILGGLVCAAVPVLFGLITRVVSGKSNNMRLGGIVATALCVIAPIIMAVQEWDDHDRSNKLLAPDMGRNYLESCPKDAILFTFGDNDTYPLWYAQEVEGVRPDIRIVNTSLLGIDWYVNQLRYKVNQSAPFNIVWSEDQLKGFSYVINGGQSPTATQPLIDFLKSMAPALNDPDKTDGVRASFPSSLTVPVNLANVQASGAITTADSILPEIRLDIPNKNYIPLDQLTMLSVLATSDWKRPICFTNFYNELGFGPYLRQEGLIYHLVPMMNSGGRELDANKTYALLTQKFRSGNASTGKVYFDEENRRHLLSIRQTYAFAASTLVADGKLQDANTLLTKSESLISDKSLPFGMVSRGNFHNQVSMIYLEAAYKSKNLALVGKIKDALRRDLMQQKAYYNYIKEKQEDEYRRFARDEQDCDRFLRIMDEWEKQYSGAPTVVPENVGGRRDS